MQFVRFSQITEHCKTGCHW